MHIRRITREEVHRLSRRRKRYRLGVACGALTVAAAVFIFAYIGILKEKNISEKHGKEVTVGSSLSLGVYDYEVEQYDTIEKNLQNEMVDGMEYIVPDTALDAVESVAGNNIADSGVYARDEEKVKPLSYFSDTVFIGDSRTEALVLYAGVPNINAFCYKGLSVDKLSTDKVITVPGISGRLTCYDAIDETEYSNYYLMFGMNELGWVYIEPFIDNFNELIDYIYEHNPDANVYVESILPVSKEESDTSDIYTQDRIDEFNDALVSMCRERGDVIYLDLAAAVTDASGYLPEDASVDGIHCNADYCKRLIQYIRMNVYNRIK